ncbi:MAG: transposase family protein, partial [Candidatus Hodarchaeales archaeon]
MKFDKPVKQVFKDTGDKDFFDEKCPFCGSTELVIRSSRIREIPDPGSTVKQVIIRLRVTTFRCKGCNKNFTPEHPLYPPKFEYSHDIIEYSLTRYHYHNASGNVIAR